MRTIGFPELVVLIIPICFYAISIWVVWKFYQILVRMNDNLSGIRDALSRREREPL